MLGIASGRHYEENRDKSLPLLELIFQHGENSQVNKTGKLTEQKAIKWSGRKTQEGKIAQDKGL